MPRRVHNYFQTERGLLNISKFAVQLENEDYERIDSINIDNRTDLSMRLGSPTIINDSISGNEFLKCSNCDLYYTFDDIFSEVFIVYFYQFLNENFEYVDNRSYEFKYTVRQFHVLDPNTTIVKYKRSFILLTWDDLENSKRHVSVMYQYLAAIGLYMFFKNGRKIEIFHLRKNNEEYSSIPVDTEVSYFNGRCRLTNCFYNCQEKPNEDNHAGFIVHFLDNGSLQKLDISSHFPMISFLDRPTKVEIWVLSISKQQLVLEATYKRKYTIVYIYDTGTCETFELNMRYTFLPEQPFSTEFNYLSRFCKRFALIDNHLLQYNTLIPLNGVLFTISNIKHDWIGCTGSTLLFLVNRFFVAVDIERKRTMYHKLKPYNQELRRIVWSASTDAFTVLDKADTYIYGYIIGEFDFENAIYPVVSGTNGAGRTAFVINRKEIAFLSFCTHSGTHSLHILDRVSGEVSVQAVESEERLTLNYYTGSSLVCEGDESSVAIGFKRYRNVWKQEILVNSCFENHHINQYNETFESIAVPLRFLRFLSSELALCTTAVYYVTDMTVAIDLVKLGIELDWIYSRYSITDSLLRIFNFDMKNGAIKMYRFVFKEAMIEQIDTLTISFEEFFSSCTYHDLSSICYPHAHHSVRPLHEFC
ncbi:hypothetical protein PCE1_004333 [Barthelona sp. PCE]